MPFSLALRWGLLLSIAPSYACAGEADRLTAMEKELSAMRQLLLEQAAQNQRLSGEVELNPLHPLADGEAVAAGFKKLNPLHPRADGEAMAAGSKKRFPISQ
jgi:hypothetical protein